MSGSTFSAQSACPSPSLLLALVLPLSQIKKERKPFTKIKQLLEVQINMWRNYKGNSTLGTKSWAAQLFTEARRVLRG